MIPILCAFCFLNGWKVPKRREDQNRPREGSTGKLSKGDRSRPERGKRWATGADSPLTLFSYITPATQGDQSFLPCAFGALTLTDYKPSWSRSGSGHRCARCHQGETYEFLRETDPARDLWSRQQGLDAARTTEIDRQHFHRKARFQCPTLTCYATEHWRSAANKKSFAQKLNRFTETNTDWGSSQSRHQKMIWICYQLSFLELALQKVKDCPINEEFWFALFANVSLGNRKRIRV